MKLYMKSVRDGQTQYTEHDGMNEVTARRLMAEIGHTEIQVLDEEVYNLAVQALQPPR